MEAKEVVQRAYDLFGAGDMEGFMNEIVHDDVTWTFSGEEGKHPLVGVHQGKANYMANMAKIPEYWNNFSVKPVSMISEDNKVFVIVNEPQKVWTHCLVTTLKLLTVKLK